MADKLLLKRKDAEIEFLKEQIKKYKEILAYAINCIEECEYSLTKTANSRVEEAINEWNSYVENNSFIYYPNKYGNVWISKCKDCGENEGGFYCQVYADEDMTEQIDDFCIHPSDCDCNNEEAVKKFIKKYAKMYQQEKPDKSKTNIDHD